MKAKKNVVLLLGLILILIPVSFSQDDVVSEIITLYNTIEGQLQVIRGEVGQIQSDIKHYAGEVSKLGKNTQAGQSYDQAKINEIATVQVSRAEDLEKLLTARDLWQKNFAVVNKTFGNIRRKIAL